MNNAARAAYEEKLAQLCYLQQRSARSIEASSPRLGNCILASNCYHSRGTSVLNTHIPGIYISIKRTDGDG